MCLRPWVKTPVLENGKYSGYKAVASAAGLRVHGEYLMSVTSGT